MEKISPTEQSLAVEIAEEFLAHKKLIFSGRVDSVKDGGVKIDLIHSLTADEINILRKLLGGERFPIRRYPPEDQIRHNFYLSSMAFKNSGYNPANLEF